MKRISVVWLIIIFSLIGIISAVEYVKLNPPAVTETREQVPNPEVLSLPEAAPASQISEPQNLSIPAINVSAFVEEVGEDAQGKMDVPKGVFNAGWYNLGFKPGENGNAVMAGHLDTATGAPAVFYSVGSLKKGDQVIVTAKDGKNLTFEVTEVKTYPFDKVPLKEIFGPSDKPKLNLITCVGVWDIGTRNYSERLVVYAELVS